MRLNPRLKFIAEFAARKQRRSLANFVEWAIDSALRQTPTDANNLKRTVYDEGSALWDLDEAERFIRLAEEFIDLLTYDEQVLWDAIRKDTYSINSAVPSPKRSSDDTTETMYKKLAPVYRSRVKRCWNELKAFSEGKLTEEQFRKAITERLKPSEKS
jgi:hypothetical protein